GRSGVDRLKSVACGAGLSACTTMQIRNPASPMRFRWILLIVSLLGWPAGVLAASPELQGVTPRGAQRGTEADLVFTGSRLADARDVLFYEPGITVTKVESSDAQHAKVHVRIDKDARIGIYPMRIRTGTGLSELRTFCVTPYPVAEEREPNNDLGTAQSVELNTTVTGTIQNEDVDTFAIEAKKGQRITAEVIGIRLGDAMFDPYVAILDSKRFAIAESDD